MSQALGVLLGPRLCCDTALSPGPWTSQLP